MARIGPRKPCNPYLLRTCLLTNGHKQTYLTCSTKTSNLRENGRETFASIIYTAGQGSPRRKNVGEGTKEASLDELLLGTVVQCDGKSTGPGVRSRRI